MIDRRAFSLAVVACCLLATVSLSASLESAVETSPGEEIELDYGSLPLSVQEASELKRSYHSGGSGEDRSPASTSSSTGSDGDPDPSSPGGETEDSAGSSDADRPSGASNADRSSGASDADRPGSDGRSDPDRGLLEMLAAFLSTPAKWLPWLVVTVVVLLPFSQRDRLLAWARRTLYGHWPAADGGTVGGRDHRSYRPPRNAVERSWLELLSRADVDADPSATPREIATELVDAGLDRRAVWELTELFEETRYDDAPVTSDRVLRAFGCLRRCRREEVTAE